MDCKDIRSLLEAHVDGELELGQRLIVEHHLRECPTCQAMAVSLQSRRSAIRDALPRHSAPDVLTNRIRDSLRRQSSVPPKTSGVSSGRLRWNRYALWSTALAAGLVLGLFAGYHQGLTRGRSDAVTAHLVENHVRSLLPGHLTDVTSTDQHTVKPWFAGRLPFSPTVIDLAPEGFPLVGGRLERVDEQPAAALVYQRNLHRLNLLIWPATLGKVSSGTRSLDGYRVISWTYSDFNYAVVSDLQERELSQFADTLRSRLAQ